MQYLLGFHRKNKIITPIYSDSPYFFDTHLQQKYEAKIVPLKVWKNNFNWQTSDDSVSAPNYIKQLFTNNFLFITSDKTESPFYALMYPLANVPSMTRAGYLLEKKGDKYLPVIQSIDGIEYLVEMKGCGSPIGKFPNVHSRNQAGCIQKSHLRLTGAFEFDNGDKEYKNLEENRAYYRKTGKELHVRALGIIKFKYLEKEFCVLLRLVPSTLRASYCQNIDIDKLQPKTNKSVLFCMGQEIDFQLKKQSPMLHANVNRNNMVYVDKTEFALTDWSEAQPAYLGPNSLDYIQNVYPIEFLTGTIPIKEYIYFIKGVSEDKVKNKITKKELLKLNTVFLQENISLKVFKKRIESPFSIHSVKENSQLIEKMMPKTYFETPLLKWIEKILIPEYKKKKQVNKYYQTLIQTKDISLFDSSFNFNNPKNESEKNIRKHILLIAPEIEKLLPSSKVEKEDLGTFNAKENFQTKYLLISSKAKIDKNLKDISYILKEAKQYLINQSVIKLPSTGKLLNQQFTPSSPSLINIIFPYYVFLLIYFENERIILEGVGKQRSKLSLYEQNQLDLISEKLNKNINILQTEPVYFHEQLQKGYDVMFESLKLYPKQR
jgi:hypothetical protein